MFTQEASFDKFTEERSNCCEAITVALQPRGVVVNRTKALEDALGRVPNCLTGRYLQELTKQRAEDDQRCRVALEIVASNGSDFVLNPRVFKDFGQITRRKNLTPRRMRLVKLFHQSLTKPKQDRGLVSASIGDLVGLGSDINPHYSEWCRD